MFSLIHVQWRSVFPWKSMFPGLWKYSYPGFYACLSCGPCVTITSQLGISTTDVLSLGDTQSWSLGFLQEILFLYFESHGDDNPRSSLFGLGRRVFIIPSSWFKLPLLLNGFGSSLLPQSIFCQCLGIKTHLSAYMAHTWASHLSVSHEVANFFGFEFPLHFWWQDFLLFPSLPSTFPPLFLA